MEAETEATMAFGSLAVAVLRGGAKAMPMSTARGDRSDPSLASLMRDEEASRFGDEANRRRREAREKRDSRENTRSTFF